MMTEYLSLGDAKNKGYDNQFIDPVPSNFICPICKFVERDAVLVTCCGKTYCKHCLLQQKNPETGVFECPSCFSDLAEHYKHFPDKITNTKISHLRTACRNKERGCKWIGYLKNLEIHCQECPNETVECTNKKLLDQCRAKMQRCELQAHMTQKCEWRIVRCHHCNVEGTFNYISQKHRDTCPELEMPCGNEGCTEAIKRCQQDDHHAICPKEIIRCNYHVVGCDEQFTREHSSNHNGANIGSHLDMAMAYIQDLESIAQMNTVMKLHIPKQNTSIISSGFYVSKGGIKIAIKAKCDKRNSVPFNLQLSVAVMSGRYDDLMSWPIKGKIKTKLLNQKEDRNHKVSLKDVVFENKILPPNVYGKWMPAGSFIFNSLSAHLYSLDDYYYIRVSIDTAVTNRYWLV